LGVRLPGISRRGWIVAVLVNFLQGAIIVYSVVFTLVVGHGVTLVNNILTLVQCFLPMLFLHLLSQCDLVFKTIMMNGNPTFERWHVFLLSAPFVMMCLTNLTYFATNGIFRAFVLTFISLVLWAPSFASVLVCFVVVAHHCDNLCGVVADAIEAHPTDELAALIFIKQELLKTDDLVEKETKLASRLFVLPSVFLSVLFILDALWVLFDFIKTGGIDDDEGNETGNMLFFSFKAAQLMALLVAVLMPVAMLNGAVDKVGDEVLLAFYGSPSASAAVHWMTSSRIGWKIGWMRPNMGVARAFFSTLLSAALITLSRLIF
jgi:hypothetical protein